MIPVINSSTPWCSWWKNNRFSEARSQSLWVMSFHISLQSLNVNILLRFFFKHPPLI